MIGALRLRLASVLAAGGIGRSILKVGGATVLAQVVGVLALPILSRLYDQEAFGRFGLFFNLVTVSGVISTLGLHEAVVAAGRRSDGLALLAGGIVANTAMSLLIAPLTFVLISRDHFGLGVLPLWSAALVGPTQWLIGMAMMLQLWAIRKRSVDALARSALGQGAGRAGVQIAFGVVPTGWLGLLAGELAGRGLSVGVLGVLHRADLRAAARISAKRIAATVARFRSFPLWRTPSHLANNLAYALPLFLMASAFSAATVGQFSFMMLIVAAPVGLVLRAVGDVFLGEFGARFRTNPESARRLLLRTAAGLSAIALPASVVLGFAGPVLFAWAFGAQWREAGMMAAAYAPVLVGNLVVAPLGGALNVARRPAFKLFVDLAGLGLQSAGFMAARSMGLGPTGTASAIFIGYALAYGLYLVLILIAIARPGPLPSRAAPRRVRTEPGRLS